MNTALRLLTLALCSGAAASAQILQNGSFETDSLGSTSLTGWSLTANGNTFTSASVVSTNVTDGAQSASLTIAPSAHTPGFGFVTLLQQQRDGTHGLVPGTNYTYSGSISLPSGYSAANTFLRMKVYRSDQFDEFVTTNFKDTSANFSISFTYVSGTINFELDGANYSNSTPVVVALDNVRVEAAPIPEPSSAAALGALGALGFAATRRRQRRVS